MEISIGQKYTLAKDVDSIARKGHQYASAGEVVSIISIVDHVAIVESEKGIKMPIIINEHLKLNP